MPGHSEEDILKWAAALENASEHPLAVAVMSGAKERGVKNVPQVTDFDSITGKGVIGSIENRKLILGNEKLLNDYNVDSKTILERVRTLRALGQTVLFLGVDGKLAGILGVADPIKETAFEAIKELKENGLRLVMLTGDSKGTALAVAQKLEIDEVQADVLPQRKSEVVKELQAAGRKVAMAGDGVNDAPALAQADVGIAMGTGTDVAIQSAGITLIKGDLRGIVRARKLSQKTIRNIWQNLFFAFAYNLLGVPIAAGALSGYKLKERKGKGGREN